MSYNTKVYRQQGGAALVVANGGIVTLETGGTIVVGDVTIGRDANGVMTFTGLPTADPAVAGALWSNTGVLTVSAG